MSNDIAIVSQEQLDALAGKTGAQQTSGGNFVPQLKINYDDELDGKEIKPGTFTVKYNDVTVFAKAATFRPLTQHFQWTKYDDVAKKTINRTRFVTNMMGNDEPRDELGTIKCGKPSGKELKANPALVKKYEDVKCYRTVQGLVSLKGNDADGNEVIVDNYECALRLKGANFMPFEEDYFSKIGRGYIWDHTLSLSSKKEKNGASTYYVIHFDADFDKRLPVTVDLLDTITGLQERIEETNKAIDKKYYDVLHGNEESDGSVSALKTVSSTLSQDFEDDDIPF